MSLSANEKTALFETLRRNDGAHFKLDQDQIIKQYTQLLYAANSIQWGLIALFLLLGLMAAPLAFDNSITQKLNIFWLLGVLLGAHFVSLGLWVLSFFAGQHRHSYLRTTMTAGLKRGAKWMQIPNIIVEAFIQIRFANTCGKWFLSRLMHSMWGAYLIGGLVSALFFLLTHQVHFIWETTLLTEQSFATLTQFFSIVPAALGLTVPTLQDISQSRLDQAAQPEAMRRMWAVWVLGCVLIYGVFIRLALAGLSHLYWLTTTRKRIKTVISDINRQTIHHTTIIDPDTLTKENDEPSNTPLKRVTYLPLNETYYLFEWTKPIPLALAATRYSDTINSAHDQQQYLRSSEPSNMIIDSTVSPDRGSLRFLKQANTTCQTYYMIGSPFQKDWQTALLKEGVLAKNILELVE